MTRTDTKTGFYDVLQSTKFMIGIIMAVITSNWMSDWILSEGVYETDLEADGSVIFLRASPPPALFKQLVADFMAQPVWCDRINYFYYLVA